MKYFLDSAKIDEIRYAYENYKIDGITTNPKHILRSGKPFLEVIKEIATEFDGKKFPISVEINPHILKSEEMIKAAKDLAKISKNFVIKIPCNEQGLIAAKKLEDEGIRTNITLVFSPSQAIQAGRIGAKYVSPFIGWQEASGVNCALFLEDLVLAYENYRFKTEIIGAAIRNGNQIAQAAALGIHIVTCGLQVYKDSFTHPFTDRGLKVFQDAWDQIKGN
ncbi:MAG: transaldolase [Candidatus Lokiarchaeota archaeon]|nr:transaldolase [Candidatus Lokiarchaeota archaeon]